jgi:hypothetical protein
MKCDIVLTRKYGFGLYEILRYAHELIIMRLMLSVNEENEENEVKAENSSGYNRMPWLLHET